MSLFLLLLSACETETEGPEPEVPMRVPVVGDLLIMSVEQTRGRVDCGLEGINEDVSEERFRGIRIFDISDLARPVQVGAVQTCRGSHTHSVVSGPHMEGGDDDKIGLLYWLGRSEEAVGKNAEALVHYQRVFAVDIGFEDISERVQQLAE